MAHEHEYIDPVTLEISFHKMKKQKDLEDKGVSYKCDTCGLVEYDHPKPKNPKQPVKNKEV